MQCGLLGRRLGHSYSPKIHASLADYRYDLFEIEPEKIEAFLQNSNFTGLNVTVPYKKAVIPYLDELSPRAKELGAVNTIVRRGGKLIGHNTDYFGFLTMVRSSGLPVSGKKVLVLGSGGASNTAVAVLKELGARVIVISRNGENNYQNLNLHSDAAVIVNTTPVGMYPDVGVSPVELDLFPKLEGVLDVIYNPARTKLLMDAEKKGILAVNGLQMLVAQAKEAAEWFHLQPIEESKIGQIQHSLAAQMENLILIGMPGCGKSTLGKVLAQKLGKTFIDADEQIIRLAGKSIPEIFAQDGEAVFREWETQALALLGMQSGLVIATGGGCVTREQNYPLLHQNGRIIWLRRDIRLLPTDGRPLSQGVNLEEMYRIRKPMYEGFADLVVDNRSSIEEVANSVLCQLEESK